MLVDRLKYNLVKMDKVAKKANPCSKKGSGLVGDCLREIEGETKFSADGQR